jgi:hypothetical protein
VDSLGSLSCLTWTPLERLQRAKLRWLQGPRGISGAPPTDKPEKTSSGPCHPQLGIERDPAKLSCLGCSVTQSQSIQHMAHAATGSGGPDTLKFPGISKMTASEMQSQVDG